MAFNRTFNGEEQARLKRLIDEGMQVTFEMETLREGIRDTVKQLQKRWILNRALSIKQSKLHIKPASKMNTTSSMNLKLSQKPLAKHFKG